MVIGNKGGWALLAPLTTGRTPVITSHKEAKNTLVWLLNQNASVML